MTEAMAPRGPASLSAEPLDGLVDEPFRVRVTGMRAGADVRISAALLDDQEPPQRWTALGAYRADRDGIVDSRTSASYAGTYVGVVAGGLANSALPVPRAELAAYLEGLQRFGGRTRPLLGNKPSFSVDVVATGDGAKLGPVRLHRRYLSPGIGDFEVSHGAVRGVYYEPPTSGKVPVVVLSGSGGGLMRDHAALLASHGHPALAQSYFNHQGRASLTRIPVEIFAQGAAWLAAKTRSSAVVVMGLSRGSEAAQLAASYFPQHICGVIAVVPSPFVHGGVGPSPEDRRLAAWTIGGADVPFCELGDDYYRAAREGDQSAGPPGLIGTPYFVASWSRAEAEHSPGTRLEFIDVPILALGAEKDQMWPSALGARMIKERMTALGKGDLVELHNFAGAGHQLTNLGASSEISGFSLHSVTGRWLASGGDVEAGCEAAYTAWRIVFEFLKKIPASMPARARGTPTHG